MRAHLLTVEGYLREYGERRADSGGLARADRLARQGTVMVA